MLSKPCIVIIILNWNNAADTIECLDSLSRLEYENYRVIVIDNGSQDGSISLIRSAHPWVAVQESKENLGFAGGNNLGMQWALNNGADYVLLLNDDTVVAPDFLNRLVEAAERDPQVGMLGPSIYYYDSPEVFWSAGCSIDWRRGNTANLSCNVRDEGQHGTVPREVDFVTGCALLVRRDVLEQVGLLDERFFAYYEEAEWCLRVSRAGYKILHVPQSKVWHKISPSAREASPLVHYYMVRNRLLFLKAARAGVGAWIHTLAAEYLPMLISWSIRPKWRKKKPQRDAMIKAIHDYFFNQFGRATGLQEKVS